ncbi:5-hydroxytryptamine receptor 2C-like [Mytilus californianus]|uniref:5-hydroxytryptamine receptor 2C-like n=1 Tax=Mytilus californianus TaxID=6549 RepID=UPI002247AC2D|nr:5-hydroxytryptamine receptor 2C-like [Mytilus californianus]
MTISQQKNISEKNGTEYIQWDLLLNQSTIHQNSTNSSTSMETEYNWAILLWSPLIIFGIAGNILVCMAISMEKRLQTVTNYFLLSLAVTDLLVCVIVMPFSIINEFTGQWLFGPVLCDFYVTADVFMCTSSILHLCTISLERFMAIRAPLSNRNKSKTVVILKIIMVWVIAVTISSPITILGFIDESNVLSGDYCVLSNKHFMIYGSICAFFIPLFIMILSYSITLYLLIRQSKKCQRGNHNGKPIIRRSLSRKPVQRRPYVRFQSKLTSPNGSIVGNADNQFSPMIGRKQGRKQRLHPSLTFPIQKNTPYLSPGDVSPEKECSVYHSQEVLNSKWGKKTHFNLSSPSALSRLIKKHQMELKEARIKTDDVQTEQKASKVIGIVFIIFVVCWAPFFISNITSALCDKCHFSQTLISTFVWLGYLSSTINPIIYTMFNKTFKMTFKKLILCQYDTLQRKTRVQRWMLSNGISHYPTSSSTVSLETPC